MLADILSLSLDLASGIAGDRRLIILTYHRIPAEHDPLLNLEPHAALFEGHMRFLSRHFEPLRLSEAAQMIAERRLPRRAVCVTFDDGYANNHDVALPILKRCGVPATFYVATGFLDGDTMWNDRVVAAVRALRDGTHEIEWLGRYELAGRRDRSRLMNAVLRSLKYMEPRQREARADEFMAYAGIGREDLAGTMMSAEMVRALDAAGMEIGAHTISHPILATLADDEARREIAESKRRLEAVVGHEIRTFAYPNGRFDSDFTLRDTELVRSLGFTSAVTTECGAASRRTNPYLLPRTGLYGTKPLSLMLQSARAYRSRDRLRNAVPIAG